MLYKALLFSVSFIANDILNHYGIMLLNHMHSDYIIVIYFLLNTCLLGHSLFPGL